MSIDENLVLIDMARLQLYQQRHDNSAELNELIVWQALEPIRPILNGYDIGINANSNVVNALDNISHCSFKNVSDEDLNCIIQITERINILKSEVTQCEKEIFR